MSNTDVTLDPILAKLAGTLRVAADGRCSFPDDAVVAAIEPLLTAPQQAPLAEQLLAYALRCRREAGEGALPALAQLAFLLSLLLGADEAAAAVSDAGAGSKDALLKAIGTEASKLPVGGARPAGSTSPLGAVLGDRTKKK